MDFLKKISVVLIAFGGLVGIVLLGIKCGNGQNKFQEFNNANIQGRIKKVWSSHGASGFSLENDSLKRKFIFHPFSPTFKAFHEFAEKGDSVSKPSNDNYIRLFKNGEEYVYDFRKY